MLKIKDYIFTPADLYKGVLYLIKKAKRKDWIIFAMLILIFLFTKNYLVWQFDSSLFFIFLLAVFLWNLDSRISIAGALICLASCPIFLVLFNKNILFLGEKYAEQAAVWAYYFLVIGVFKQIWEFKNEKEKSETADKIIDINLIAEQKPVSAARKINDEKAKTIDEIIEKARLNLKLDDMRIRQNINNVKRKRAAMDIIPPKIFKG